MSDSDMSKGDANGEVFQKESLNDPETSPDLTRATTLDVDNYHGINAVTILVYASINLIVFAQIVNLVGAGALARDIAAVVGGSTKSVWLSQAIVIGTTVIGPPVGQAADFWGRKWFLVILTGFGVIGSIIVSRATSIGMAIAGEVLVGVTYGLQPLLYAVASEILPRRYRPAAQGGVNATTGVGGIVALLAGSAMVKDYHEGFRIFWYMVAALLAVSAIICAIFYNPPPRPLQQSLTTKEKINQLDWVAYLLLATGLVLFIMGLTWAENPYSWKDAHVLAPLLLGVAIIIVLIIHQVKFRKDGLFHHELFKVDRNFSLALFVIFVDGAAFFATNLYYSFEVSVLYETDPIRIGLRFCIVFFGAIVSSMLVALYASWTKSVRYPVILAFSFFVVFFVCMSTATTGSSTAVWVYPIFIGFGIGLSLTCIVTIAQLSTPPRLIAIATGLLIATRSVGAAIALAIYSSIFDSIISNHLGADIAKAVLPLGLPLTSLPGFIGALASNDQNALLTIPGVTPQIIEAGVHGLQEAYVTSFRGVWIAAAALSAVATIAACFFVEPKAITMHVDAPLDKQLTHE